MAVTELETTDVEIVNVAEVAPDITVTEVGDVALVVLDNKLTTVPPVGATPFSVTEPVEDCPPITDVGVIERLERLGGITFRVAVLEFAPWVPVMIAFTIAGTAEVEIANVAELAPAGTTTDPGTTTLVLPDERLTLNPPVGAGLVRVTVPVLELPPITDAGDTAIALRAVA